LFEQAWKQSTDDFERCIAAHYVARHQANAELALRWNQEAMNCAHRVGDGGVTEFLPSLYLNLGKSYEDLGNIDEARRNYECAAAKLPCIPIGAYRDIIEDGIRRALRRVDIRTLL
jgi:tetratricopeptide (TPR) repeat protein